MTPAYGHCPGIISVFLSTPKCPRVDDQSPGCPSVREAWRRVTYPHSESKGGFQEKEVTHRQRGGRRKGLPLVGGSRRSETWHLRRKRERRRPPWEALAAGPPGNGAGVYQTRDRGPPGRVGSRYTCGPPPKSTFPTVHLEVSVAGLKQWPNLSCLVSLFQIANRSSKSCWQGFPFLFESRWRLDCNSTSDIWRTPCFAALLG